jgi:hypothetical protein
MGAEKINALRFWINVHGGTPVLFGRSILIEAESAKAIPME